jgi:hypothetical protein
MEMGPEVALITGVVFPGPASSSPTLLAARPSIVSPPEPAETVLFVLSWMSTPSPSRNAVPMMLTEPLPPVVISLAISRLTPSQSPTVAVPVELPLPVSEIFPEAERMSEVSRLIPAMQKSPVPL